MSTDILLEKNLVRQAVIEVASLSEEDLALVIEFVDYLKQRRVAPLEGRLSATEIRLEARRRARELNNVPRQELVARFKELTERIRTQAIGSGTAIEGDWQGD
jgi:hypothetical protein